MTAQTPIKSSDPRRMQGVAFAICAYGWWGVVPLYWKLLLHVSPLEILSHRVIWSIPFLAGLIAARRIFGRLRALADIRERWLLAGSTVMVGANWGLFIWAVHSGRILEASRGYYINPLVNVILGATVLGERLTRPQVTAIALATVGVAFSCVDLGGVPWLALALALTFGAYGLLRKLSRVDPLCALLVETLGMGLPAVVTVAWLAARGESQFINGDGLTIGLLLASGAVTAVPLMMFGWAAVRIPLSLLGFFQYISPTIQFLIAVMIFNEPFSHWQLLSFVAIWSGLIVLSGARLIAPRG